MGDLHHNGRSNRRTAFGVAICLLLAPSAVRPHPLSALTPRPPMVPSEAYAYGDWKGFGGTAWVWCVATPEGRVNWGVYGKGRHAKVSVAARPCAPFADAPQAPFLSDDVGLWTDSSKLWLRSPTKIGHPSGYDGAGRACLFSVPQDRIALLRRIAIQAQAASTSIEQRQTLAVLISELGRTDGQRLTTGSGEPESCDNGPRWRERVSAPAPSGR